MTTENQVKPTDVDKALLGTATYRSLGEQKLSPQEERFEKGRRTVGLFLAPLLTVAFLVLPIDIPREQQVLAAVLLGVIALWISEAVPIPIGGLLGVAIAVFLGVAPVDDVLGPFGSSTIFTFIGAFILAQAMLKHGVARRFAFCILNLPGVGKSTTGVILAFGAITCLLSAFVSNTATVAMLLPTAIGILSVIAKLLQKRGDVEPDFDPQRLRVGAAIMLMLAYGASVGGLLTPVGSPPNLIGRGLIEEATGERISFFQWMMLALPICLLMFVLLAFILLRLNKPEIKRIDGVAEYVAEERAEAGLAVAGREEHAHRVRHHGVAVDHAGHRRADRRNRVGRLRIRQRPIRRGCGGRVRRRAAVPAADRLEGTRVHAALERCRRDRLGHNRSLRLRHHLRFVDLVDGAGRDHRHVHQRCAGPVQHRARSRSSR